MSEALELLVNLFDMPKERAEAFAGMPSLELSRRFDYLSQTLGTELAAEIIRVGTVLAYDRSDFFAYAGLAAKALTKGIAPSEYGSIALLRAALEPKTPFTNFVPGKYRLLRDIEPPRKYLNSLIKNRYFRVGEWERWNIGGGESGPQAFSILDVARKEINMMFRELHLPNPCCVLYSGQIELRVTSEASSHLRSIRDYADSAKNTLSPSSQKRV